jgi:hypothetical protein
MSKFNIFKQLEKKFKTHGLISSLALISIIGFAINAYNVYFGQELPVLFAYPSMILGIGLIFESQIIDLFKHPAYFIKTENELAKFVTFTIGLFVLLGGIASSQILALQLSPEIIGGIGISNVIAMFVILYELIWVD